MALYAQYIEDFAGGSEHSPRNLKERFGKLLLDITQTRGELKLLIAQGELGDPLLALVQRANSLVANVRHAEVLSGI